MKACPRFLLALALAWPAAAKPAPLVDVVAVAAGNVHTCALTAAGGVLCWGSNMFTQIGDSTSSDRPAPTPVTNLSSGITAIAAGGNHTCALAVNRTVKCWGSNGYGELGDGTNTQGITPSEVQGLAGIVAIAAGAQHTCALTDAGGLKCWGVGLALGNGSSSNQSTPVDVPGLTSGVTAVSAGENYTCAVMSGGEARCWGANYAGQLGDGTTTTPRMLPVTVTGIGIGVARISAGVDHTCATLLSGALKCWGGNQFGQLGDGSTANSPSPVDVSGLSSGVASVGASYRFACARSSGGAALCWGYNGVGQLGDGSFTSRAVPASVAGLASEVLEVSTGSVHACALMGNRTVRCWGANAYGQLGNDRPGDAQPIPTTVGATTPQTMTFAALPNRNVNDAPFAVAAAASSGLAITFTSLDPATCTVSGSTVTLVEIGICTIAADQAGDTNYAAAPRVLRTFLVSGVTATSPTRLANISTRGQVIGGHEVLIGGFIIGGSGPKTVVVRARGSSLAGVGNPLPDPLLRLFSGQAVIASNDNWQGGASAQTIQSIGYAPADPNESAILATLQPGAYTAIVTSAGVSTGVAIVEVFEVDRPAVPLINIATRGKVMPGNDVMIGGFIIHGNAPRTVVVRARGPSLAQFNVPNLLANPLLQLLRSSDQMQIAVNDDWQSAGNAAQVFSSGFAPPEPLEAAILITLQPGAYTAIVSGSGGGSGIGIVEVFAVP